MKKRILTILAGMCCLPLVAQYTVRGGSGLPLEVLNANHQQVVLLNGLPGAEIEFTSSGSEPHQWYRYETKATEAVPITCVQNGNTSVITDVRDGSGYFVGNTNDPNTSYVWIIDYSRRPAVLLDFQIETGSDVCEYLRFSVDAENTQALAYRTATGNLMPVKRNFHLQYTDLAWDSDLKKFVSQPVNKEIDNLTSSLVINSPLTNTVFSLTGDAFAEHFGINQTLTTEEYNAVALKVYSDTVLIKKQGETEQDEGGNRLSAPAEITFNAYANEPVAGMYIWEIQKQLGGDQTQTLLRYTGKSVTYTFEESGDFVAKLEVIGVGSVCSNDGESYDIHIGSSDLQLPNAFSPGSSSGSNDIYRVAYKSLISFKASIYNRWGNLLYHWEDPAQGWDGRVDGRFVPSGVYFIVVEATGADGKKYAKSSDINILRKKY